MIRNMEREGERTTGGKREKLGRGREGEESERGRGGGRDR